MQTTYEEKLESDDEYNEGILTDGNDRRKIICDSPNKSDRIITCIGSIESQFIPDEKLKKPESSHGTGTVIHIDTEQQIYVLTVAHNVRGVERKCIRPNCNSKTLKRSCPNDSCNSKHTVKTGNIIKPQDIFFSRRGNGILTHPLGQIIETYKAEDYKIPDEYLNFATGTGGYDIALIVLKCHDKEGVNIYKQNCCNIQLKQDSNLGGNQCVLHIYGYPGQTREEKNKRIYYYLYGMGTSKIDKDSRCKIAANNKGKLYIV
eukprot:158643_1